MKEDSLLFRLLQATRKSESTDVGAFMPKNEVPSESAPTMPALINRASEEKHAPPATPEVDLDSWVGLIVPPLSWDLHRRLAVQVNKTATKARILLRPPAQDEPETCSIDILHRVLKNCRITFGVDEDALNSFFTTNTDSLLYNTAVIVAQGIPCVKGTDGYVKELFARTNKPYFDQRPDGSMDFKNMHIVNNIAKGTVICEIINPIQGTLGISVYNKPLRPRTAKDPIIPRGENVDLVAVDAHMSQLVAAIDGNLIYKDKRFRVEHTFRVNGNVDNSVGNINFTGNVIITGDVCEGYSIKTDGDVTVFGIVEGASIYAGGNIILQKGINGMSKGILEAQKDITAKFIENCTVRAGGNIKSESVINSTVEADGGLMLVGRGTLIGGKITVCGSVEAKIVGSRSNTHINIVLGVTPNMLRERNQIYQQYKAVLSEFQSINSNILFLEQTHNIPEEVRQKRLAQNQGKLKLVRFKKNRLEARIKKFTEQQSEISPCTLICNTAYPPLRITIGSETYRLKNIANMCRFYQNSEGEVVVGTK
ncbi:MAG: DUF342 domain-containing protein [Candidatus Fimivivens sp.]